MAGHRIATVLRLAAARLERTGWTQNDFRNCSGAECSMQAIITVCELELPNMCCKFCAKQLASQVLRYLEEHLGCSVPKWNDRPERTLSEVLAVLREAADKLDSDHIEPSTSGVRGGGNPDQVYTLSPNIMLTEYVSILRPGGILVGVGG